MAIKIPAEAKVLALTAVVKYYLQWWEGDLCEVDREAYSDSAHAKLQQLTEEMLHLKKMRYRLDAWIDHSDDGRTSVENCQLTLFLAWTDGNHRAAIIIFGCHRLRHQPTQRKDISR